MILSNRCRVWTMYLCINSEKFVLETPGGSIVWGRYYFVVTASRPFLSFFFFFFFFFFFGGGGASIRDFPLQIQQKRILWSAKYFLLAYNNIIPFATTLYPVSHILNSLQRYRSLTRDMLGPWDISTRQKAMSLNQIVKADIDHDSICLSWTGVSFCQTWIIRQIIG